MRKSLFIKTILIVQIIFFCFDTFGQKDAQKANSYSEFDRIIGLENTGLFNGKRYQEIYRTRNDDHKFYNSSDYFTGNIEYDGQWYYGIQMKYDINEDQIIVNIPSFSGFSMFVLNKNKVKDFYLNNSTFVSLNNIKSLKSGFYEIISESRKFILYKKHFKNRDEYIYRKNIYNRFKNNDYYLLFDMTNYHKIVSYKDLIKIFPENKKQLKTYFKSQKKLIKSNYGLFMIRLINELNHYQDLKGPTVQ